MKDKNIRQALQLTLLKRFYRDPNIKVIEELNICLGEARIDIAVINNTLHGFEIKSEADTLIRLKSQVDIYLKVFNYLTIVTSEGHLKNVLEVVPSCCGIAMIKKYNKSSKIEWQRRATRNIYIDAFSLCQLLWKDETLNLLKGFGLTRGLSGKPKSYLWKLLAEQTSIRRLNKAVIEILQTREAWKLSPQLKSHDDTDCF